ncbi:MAG: ice-binding family protein, partial [Actinomycetota bacterium]|nr:ice-binding family protein [Actinomycetota bacterium]
MKTETRVRSILLLATIAVALVTAPAIAVAAEATVNLGTTAGFAILAGTTITNTGPTTITGDVGLHPGSAFVDTGVTLIGARHIADAVANQAKIDLVTAYNDAAGRPVGSAVPVDLGGSTLTPGVYSSGGVLGITGTLTLDAQGDPDAVFIFQSTATLITASDSRVELINGARFCRVFWVVPSSATLATDSVFAGHIFALTDITVQNGAEVEGQLLARNGQVTLDTNVVTNEICAAERLIDITKTASPTSLPAGGGTVTYTYTVTNPGTVEFSDVVVTDDMVSPVTYVSGDTNGDGIL